MLNCCFMNSWAIRGLFRLYMLDLRAISSPASMTVEQDASVSLAIQQLDSIFAPIAGPSSPTSLAVKKKRAAKREALAVSTPALMSLLPAAKKRKFQLAESRASSPGPSGSYVANNLSGPPSPRKLYRPNSLEDLLERLSSYSMALWNDGKPLQCSAVAFAGHGWRATAKKREQVTCEMCEQVWEARNSNDWSSQEGKGLQAEMVENLSSKHAKSCPWKSRPCPRMYDLQPRSLIWLMSLRSASVSPALVATCKPTPQRSGKPSSRLSIRNHTINLASTV